MNGPTVQCDLSGWLAANPLIDRLGHMVTSLVIATLLLAATHQAWRLRVRTALAEAFTRQPAAHH